MHRELLGRRRRSLRWLKYEKLLLIGTLVLFILTVSLTFSSRQGLTFEILILWGMRIALALRAIIATTNLISHEHANQTWESLILTGISARQIYVGKCSAALRSLWGIALTVVLMEFAESSLVYLKHRETYSLHHNPLVFILLAAILAVVITFVETRQIYVGKWWAALRSHWGIILFLVFLGFAWTPFVSPWRSSLTEIFSMILGLASALAIPFLEVVTCAAIGIAASTLTRRNMVAIGLAIAIRFIPVLIFAFAALVAQLNSPIFLSFADGGTVATIAMPIAIDDSTLLASDYYHGFQFTIGAGGSFLALIVLLVTSRSVALVMLQRGGALPQQSPLLHDLTVRRKRK